MNMKRSCIRYTRKSELDGVIVNTRSSIGHGGRRSVIKEHSDKYKNVASAVVELFLNLYEPCR